MVDPSNHRPGLFSPFRGSEAFEAALKVFVYLRGAGHRVYFVGGCVRDALLCSITGRLPRRAEDFDIASDAPPGRVASLFPSTHQVGASFGVTVVSMDGHNVEVAQFRREGPYTDGRHPDFVREATPVEDSARRDFTVNAMMYDPESGELLDYQGGAEDLRAGILRFIGDPKTRIVEDRLRLLRAARFACTYGFAMTPDSRSAVVRHANLISTVSAERIAEELRRMLASPSRACCVSLLDELGLLAHIMPEAVAMKGVPQPPDYHPEGDVFTHTLLAIEKLPADAGFALSLAALLHDAGKPATFARGERITFHGHDAHGARIAADICHRLRLSGEETEEIVYLVGSHMKFVSLPDMRRARALAFLSSKWASDCLDLYLADIEASTKNLATYRYACELLEQAREIPPPYVKGEDVIRLGVPPGPAIGHALRESYARQIEGRYATREEALSDLGSITGGLFCEGEMEDE